MGGLGQPGELQAASYDMPGVVMESRRQNSCLLLFQNFSSVAEDEGRWLMIRELIQKEQIKSCVMVKLFYGTHASG